MPLLTSLQLRRLEKTHAEGVSSATVVKIFTSHGEKFSEATLRKYVQLGLLPTSRRVGISGRQRGSSGLYPVSILRQAWRIKKALEGGHSLDSLRTGSFGLSCDLDSMRRQVQQLSARFVQAIEAHAEKRQRSSHKKGVAAHKRALLEQLDQLHSLAQRLSDAESL